MASEQQGLHATGRMPTGIAGFDAIAHGGLPRGGVTVVLGGAGSGKTVLAMQMLVDGARTHGEQGIMVAFEESAERIVAHTAGFTWGGEAILREGVHILDASVSQTVVQGGEFDLVGLLAVLSAKVKQVGARRVVFDGVDVLLSYLGDPALVRREIFRLSEWVHGSGVTAILTAKRHPDDVTSAAGYEMLEFIADCVVTLHHRLARGIALRFIRVAKLRGGDHSANEFPVTIGDAGIELAGNNGVELAHSVSNERVSTGVERLDAMLTGGYHRGSSVLITGVPGTAKTSLAAAFAEAAARRGERTLYVSFDEAPDQIIRNVASIGIKLAPHAEAGTLHFASLRARAESPEAHVARIRSLLRRLSPRHLVVDPLSALSHLGSEADAEGAALQLIDLAKSAGITILSTSLLGNPVPLSEQTPLNISTIADTWMHVTYVSQAGERNRALTIIKSRGTGHSNQVRELKLSEAGVTLADVYAVGGEVLLGTLRWEKENEARRERAAALESARLREQRAELALAETQARAETLDRQKAIQEAELVQARAEMTRDVSRRDSEAQELLQLRRVDRAPATIIRDAEPTGGRQP